MRPTIIPVVAAAVVVVAVALVVAWPEPTPPPGSPQDRSTTSSLEIPSRGEVRHVSPTGTDDNHGLSADQPLATIQAALDSADPGTVVQLASGIYDQDFRTVIDGRPDAPILVTGPPDAVVRGGGAIYVVQVNHDHHVFQGFTIDGHFGDDEPSGYRQKLLYAQGTERRSGVTGLRLLDMRITNALDECVRLRYFAVDNEIAGNSISNCGLQDFKFDGSGKNGEGVYIGTAPDQTDDDSNPTDEPDRSSRNVVRNNRITGGGECVNLKEGTTENVVEGNTCVGPRDDDSGGIDVRGSGNIVRGNTVTDGQGVGIRLGAEEIDAGIDNDVVGNVLRDNDEGGIKFMAAPQGQVCENTVSGSDVAVGDFADEFDADEVTAPCGGGRNA